jgi:Holliday junction DNA helicase RuvB
MHRHSHTVHSYERSQIRRELFSRPTTLGAVGTTPQTSSGSTAVVLKPLSFDQRSGNELRPANFADMVGQDRLKRLVSRIVAAARRTGRPLDHILLSGQAGTGKTTFGQVVAHESGRTVYQVKAPVSHGVMLAIRQQCKDGDVIVVDEIHQQVSGDRRGVTQACDPEDFYHVMEDRRLPTEGAMLSFPAVTFIGCTTDEGLLPEAFLRRFPLKLTLDPYTPSEMAQLAVASARQLGVAITIPAASMLGLASRRNPSQLNVYIRNAASLGYDTIDGNVAREVIEDLNGCTLDGLTPDMQRMLVFLLRNPKRYANGRVVHQASVNTIATALGHSRDTKAVSLYVEPYLISEGFVSVQHGGRTLTDAGVQRARELS